MTQQTFRLDEVQPNPFRNIAVYPIDRDKVEALKASFRNTSIWPVLMARLRSDGKPEQAFGHHRIVAAREEFGSDGTITLNIEGLSDDDMLKMMANENMAEYKASATVIIETVSAVYQHKFPTGRRVVAGDETTPVPHYEDGQGETGEIIAGFLGWPLSRIDKALAFIESEKAGEVTIADLGDMSLEKASIARQSVEKAVEEYAEHAPKATKDRIRREAYRAVREDKVGKRGVGEVVDNVIASFADERGVYLTHGVKREPPKVQATSLIRGISSEMNQLRMTIERLNDLFIAHPEVVDPTRKVTDHIGKGNTLAQSINHFDPELDMLRDVIVHGLAPKPRLQALPSGTAPEGTKVVSA